MAILRWLSTVNSYLLLVGGAFVMLLMACSVYIAYTPLLWVDQWAFLQELVGNHGHYGLQLLWKHHGDHQIALPKLFYLADLYLFGGANKLLLLSIFGLQLLHLGWLIATFRVIGRLSILVLWSVLMIVWVRVPPSLCPRSDEDEDEETVHFLP